MTETPPNQSPESETLTVTRAVPAGDDPLNAPELARARFWPVVVWLVALAVIWLWGEWLEDNGYVLVQFRTQPFLGGPDIVIERGIWLVLVLAIASVVYLPIAARRLSWWPMLLTAWGTAIVWTLSLTTIRGTAELARPLLRDDDYLNSVPLANQDLLGFLSTFTDEILNYPVHVQGHPPGQVVLLTLLARIGITAPTAIAVLYVIVGTSALVAVGVTVKSLSGRGPLGKDLFGKEQVEQERVGQESAGGDLAEDSAQRLSGELIFRRAMPFMVLVPAVVWIATSPDAFFGGVLAWGIALLALATRYTWVAVPAGLVLGFCPFLSYGLLTMGVVLLAVVLYRRAWGVALIAAASGVLVIIAFAAMGFRIDEGIFATQTAWELNGASVRPYWFFAVANFGVLATLVGPAALAGLPGSRTLPKLVRWLIWFAIGAAVISSLSGYMRGEVERIWLPLVFWIALAAAIPGPRRAWLAASIPVALICQIVIDSPW